ncbi:MAG: ATP-dependent RecD-like DNA helicase [Fibrobacter sp.]|nr:ATP-dependent RecD-like DNA helicase [Fibrobacter sp.]
MDTLKGIIADVSFQNEDTGFTVIQLQVQSPKNRFTCVGIMPAVSPGESVTVEGQWETHKKFGKQLNVKKYEIYRPTTLEGISMLLSSGLISNIGPVRSKAIIDCFGLSTLTILDNEPQRLIEVPGIGKKTVRTIKGAWEKQKYLRSLMLFLQPYNISVNLAVKIFKKYGNDAQQKIKDNPYCLISHIHGVGFIKADQIAQKMGFSFDSYKRIRAGLVYVMQEAANEGNSCLPQEKLLAKACEILGVEEKFVTYSFDHAIKTGILINDNGVVYLPSYHKAETDITLNIHNRLQNPVQKRPDFSTLNEWIEEYQKKSGWRGDSRQLDAIKNAIVNPVFLLTGGPGTGKTTVLQVIVSLFTRLDLKIVLAAPTGRAAQRMGNIAGIEARTIHRLLDYVPGEKGFKFKHNQNNPIDADVVIVDEMSMVDLLIMYNFLCAIKKTTSLIFVGDNNQLPSVGAGNVLADLISSNLISHVHLTRIFRQAAASRIVTSAHEIIRGILPRFTNEKTDNCFFLKESQPQSCLETIVDLVSHRLPARYGFDPVSGIQVLSPMHRGVLGTDNLNTHLQKALNSNNTGFSRGQYNYFKGDKVMQIRNNYNIGVFNGDSGIIRDIDNDKTVTVQFSEHNVEYEFSDLDQIIPAYCISIHKSQGSEFDAVIIPLVTQHYLMLQRNLLYTALTRAKKLCVFVGTYKALSIAVNNNKALKRYSGLAERLQKQSKIIMTEGKCCH